MGKAWVRALCAGLAAFLLVFAIMKSLDVKEWSPIAAAIPRTHQRHAAPARPVVQGPPPQQPANTTMPAQAELACLKQYSDEMAKGGSNLRCYLGTLMRVSVLDGVPSYEQATCGSHGLTCYGGKTSLKP